MQRSPHKKLILDVATSLKNSAKELLVENLGLRPKGFALTPLRSLGFEEDKLYVSITDLVFNGSESRNAVIKSFKDDAVSKGAIATIVLAEAWIKDQSVEGIVVSNEVRERSASEENQGECILVEISGEGVNQIWEIDFRREHRKIIFMEEHKMDNYDDAAVFQPTMHLI